MFPQGKRIFINIVYFFLLHKNLHTEVPKKKPKYAFCLCGQIKTKDVVMRVKGERMIDVK